MPRSRVLTVQAPAANSAAAAELRDGIEAIRAELGVRPEFSAGVEEAAIKAAANPQVPSLDRTDIAFVTIDPATSLDLDQALHLERRDEGYRVHYAIADLGAFLMPGDPVDIEARRRGQTLYGADSKIPLHPKAISEGAGSLLPDQVRPALLWTIDLDAVGEGVHVHVERALVRSRAKLSYEEVQQRFDEGSIDDMLALLKVVGELRLAREEARGGVSLPLPEQEVRIDGELWSLEFRQLLPVETWNAQISLLTGMAAAFLMVTNKVGILRTLPAPQQRDLARLRRTARALGVAWPEAMSYPDFVRTLDPARPAHAAVTVACTRLLRGSGYVAFDGALPEAYLHSAVAAPYSHVTAPLRRLVDRFAGEICVALCAGAPVPDWVREAMDELPELMRDSTRLANAYENAILDLVETEVLKSRVGEEFDAVVVDVEERDARKGEITIAEPAVEAPVSAASALPLGERVRVVLAEAEVSSRTVRFELV